MEIDYPSKREKRLATFYFGLFILPYFAEFLYLYGFYLKHHELSDRLAAEGQVAISVGIYYLLLSIYFVGRFLRYNKTAYKQERWPPNNHHILVKYKVRKGVDAKRYSLFAFCAFVFLASVTTIPNFHEGYVQLERAKVYRELEEYVQ